VEQVIKVHAKNSASGSPRWAFCHAAPRREAALPWTPSGQAADWGTVAHDLSEGCLRTDDSYLTLRQGSRALVDAKGRVTFVPADNPSFTGGHMVDDEMTDCVERYVSHIRKLAMGGSLYVEQRLSIEHITGEPGAQGTSDAVVLFDDEIYVGDLKGGYQRVMASYPLDGHYYELAPEYIKRESMLRGVRFPNLQGLMYAEAARHLHDPEGKRFKRVRISIIQPRLNHVDEYLMEMDEFAAWVDWLKVQAAASRGDNPRVLPSESTCQWCRAFPCKEATEMAVKAAVDDFDDKPRVIDANDLGALKRLVPFVRAWADAIDTRVHEELCSGRPVDGWKLIEGELGDRKWASDETVRKAFSDLGLKPDQYLNSKTISPAQAEKLVINKRASPGRVLTKEQWETLQGLIAPRSVGAPKVAPESDPRPPLDVNPAADFDDPVSDFFN
jgi:hypothetical protein